MKPYLWPLLKDILGRRWDLVSMDLLHIAFDVCPSSFKAQFIEYSEAYARAELARRNCD